MQNLAGVQIQPTITFTTRRIAQTWRYWIEVESYGSFLSIYWYSQRLMDLTTSPQRKSSRWCRICQWYCGQKSGRHWVEDCTGYSSCRCRRRRLRIALHIREVGHWSEIHPWEEWHLSDRRPSGSRRKLYGCVSWVSQGNGEYWLIEQITTLFSLLMSAARIRRRWILSSEERRRK